MAPISVNTMKSFRRWRHRVIFALAVLALGLCLAPLLFIGVGHWLVVADPLKPARAVVVFGGHLPFRAMEAADIFHERLVQEVWLTQGAIHEEDVALTRLGIQVVREDEYSRRVLERLGVPPGSIRLLEGRVDNTAEEVSLTAREMRQLSADRVILLTSKNHTRRVRVIWGKLVGQTPQAIVRFTPYDSYDPNHWWRNSRDGLAVTREILGILNAWAGFPLPSSR